MVTPVIKIDVSVIGDTDDLTNAGVFLERRLSTVGQQEAAMPGTVSSNGPFSWSWDYPAEFAHLAHAALATPRLDPGLVRTSLPVAVSCWLDGTLMVQRDMSLPTRVFDNVFRWRILIDYDPTTAFKAFVFSFEEYHIWRANLPQGTQPSLPATAEFPQTSAQRQFCTTPNEPPALLFSAFVLQDFTRPDDSAIDMATRQAYFQSMCKLAGPLLGFNATSFAAWPLAASNVQFASHSINAPEVQATADNAGIAHSCLYSGNVFANTPLHKLVTGKIIKNVLEPCGKDSWEDGVYERLHFQGVQLLDFLLAPLDDMLSDVQGLSLLGKLALDEIEALNVNDYYASPWSRLRHVVFGDEYWVADRGIASLLARQDSFAVDEGFYTALDAVTAGAPGTPDQTTFRTAFLDYLRSVNPLSNFWIDPQGDFKDVEPICLYGPFAAPENMGLQERRIFVHTCQFIMQQYAKGMVRVARVFTEAIAMAASRSVPPSQPPHFGISFGNNVRLCKVLRCMNDSWTTFTFLPSQLALAREARAANRTQPSISITTFIEDNDLYYRLLHHHIGYAEMLRSAAMASRPLDTWGDKVGPGNPSEFGIYARLTGGDNEQTDEVLYRILTYVGRGAKIIDCFRFTPLGEDGWSQYRSRAHGVAKAASVIHAAGDTLQLGRPARARIAILTTSSSELWNRADIDYLYQSERINLATALNHAGHAVDYIDEEDVADNLLLVRGYAVLYLQDPNIRHDLPDIIAAWVNSGGILAVSPGAAIHDEYDVPIANSPIDRVLGVRPRTLCIDAARQARLAAAPRLPGCFRDRPLYEKLHMEDPSTSLAIGDFQNPTEQFRVWQGYATPAGLPAWQFQIDQPGVSILYAWTNTDTAFSTPFPALTRQNFGLGQAFCFGVYPGALYENAAISERTPNNRYLRSPHSWSERVKSFAVLPASASKLVHEVSVKHLQTTSGTTVPSHRGAIDTGVLWHGNNLCVTISNWERPPLAAADVTALLEISILLQASPTSVDVTSARGATLSSRLEGARCVITLSIDTVDCVVVKPTYADENFVGGPFGDKLWCDVATGQIDVLGSTNPHLAAQINFRNYQSAVISQMHHRV